MDKCPTQFSSREALIEHVKNITPHVRDDVHVSPIKGGIKAMRAKLNAIDSINYGNTRNFLSGHVTKLSPYIRHGLVSLNEVRNHALKKAQQPEQVGKFIQELAWRDFWQRVRHAQPHWMWEDVEPYKTGFAADDYSDTLPNDIANAATDSPIMNHFIKQLLEEGYVHNHARMYLASYVVHWRRVKWQAGAQWFLEHLLDGDVASNNLSWQWVASTYSNKPYFFNLENIQKYCGDVMECSASENPMFDASYEDLEVRLFPHKEDVS